jgi:hypothetical protein
VKFFNASADAYSFEFDLREKQMLFQVLGQYPLVPVVHHRLSRLGSPPAAPGQDQQAWLEESLAAHREETRQRVRRLMANPGNFPPKGGGFRWTAARADMEWMLQVLNDVRVGSWLALGSPDLEVARQAAPKQEALAHWVTMDIAGGFETIFIAVLNGELPAQEE